MLNTIRPFFKTLELLYISLTSAGDFQFAALVSAYQAFSACSESGYFLQNLTRLEAAITRTGK